MCFCVCLGGGLLIHTHVCSLACLCIYIYIYFFQAIVHQVEIGFDTNQWTTLTYISIWQAMNTQPMNTLPCSY